VGSNNDSKITQFVKEAIEELKKSLGWAGKMSWLQQLL